MKSENKSIVILDDTPSIPVEVHSDDDEVDVIGEE